MGKILNLAFVLGIICLPRKRNHAISAKTGYYCEGKIHGDTRVVEWSPTSNSCTHTLAGEIHYCLLDSITLAPLNLAPLELLIILFVD